MSSGELADKLGIDRKAAWRRARVALDRGYLRNLEDRKHRPHKLVLGEPMPEERDLLPDPALLSDGSLGQLSSHPHSGPLTGRDDSGNGEWSQGHTDSEEVSKNTHSEREEFVV